MMYLFNLVGCIFLLWLASLVYFAWQQSKVTLKFFESRGRSSKNVPNIYGATDSPGGMMHSCGITTYYRRGTLMERLNAPNVALTPSKIEYVSSINTDLLI